MRTRRESELVQSVLTSSNGDAIFVIVKDAGAIR